MSESANPGPERGLDDSDALREALILIERAAARRVPLRLVGGLAVRYLTPDYPPRTRARQDLDLASVSRARPQLTDLLAEAGYVPDRRFNALYGHKQLFFQSPQRRAVDVLVDRMEMCHVLEFADRIERHPITLEVTDLLLTKLQIVDLTEKDVRDAVYLLSAFPVTERSQEQTIGLDRFGSVLADDWGWWRTVTLNLERIADLAGGQTPAGATHDPGGQLAELRREADRVPKGLRWRIRARVGERKRWYRVPEEDSHD